MGIAQKTYLQHFPGMLSYTVPGDVAQLGERDNRTVEVRGSSPLISTTSQKCLANRRHAWYSIERIRSPAIGLEMTKAVSRSSRSTFTQRVVGWCETTPHLTELACEQPV